MIEQLRLIEIELFSYCNRKCHWCPNRDIDRTGYKELENDIFYKLLKEIKASGYSNPITFSRYNEPMSYIDVFKEKLIEIRKILPNKLITNTNGDFITKENLEGLLIDELTIMDYDNDGIDYCKEKLIKAGATVDKVVKNYIYAHKDDMKILYYTNWDKYRNITDRGGVLTEYSADVRTTPCYEPTYFVGINYDGTVSPCCNIRNDVDKLKPYIIGDLHDSSLEGILTDKKVILFRENCANGVFGEDSPCHKCGNCGGRYTSGKVGIDYE